MVDNLFPPDSCATIMDWNSAEPAYVIALSNTPVGAFEFLASKAEVHDPDYAVCMTAKAAAEWLRSGSLMSSANCVAVPHSLAQRLQALVFEIGELRSDLSSYQQLIKDAVLPVDVGEAEQAKLIVTSDEVEPHFGGGSVSYFELDEKYMVVERAEFDKLEIAAKTSAMDAATPGWRDLKYPNGQVMFTADGTMLDEHGNRSIFDDVDSLGPGDVDG